MKDRLLFFTDRDNGRDVEMLLPLRFFAEELLGLSVQHAFLYDYDAIRRYKPITVVLPNTIGSHEFFFISKYCFDQKIPVFALDSEGNFRTDGTFNHWGYNTDQTYYQEYICCWSNRTRDYLISKEPLYKEKIVTVGGVGFDRYKIYRFMEKDDYFKLRKTSKYDYVVGYASWAFGKMHYNKGRDSLVSYFKGDRSKLSIMEQQRKEVEEILKHSIEHNPDVLFILKKHPLERRPTELGDARNEINNLRDYPNVIIEEGEISIGDLINVCDVWLSFESTTAIEAWLLNKPTILIRTNPQFTNTLEEKGLVDSQCIADTSISLQNYIHNLKEKGLISEFKDEEKHKNRKEVVNKSIGFDDGFNHIRAGIYLYKTTQAFSQKEVKYRFRVKSFIIWLLILLGRTFYIKSIYKRFPLVKKFVWVFEEYGLENVAQLYERKKPYLKEFYNENKIKELYDSGKLEKMLFENVMN
ncbi:MAG: hypothetical protein AAF363_05350 [Bacteroidota bacterium]